MKKVVRQLQAAALAAALLMVAGAWTPAAAQGGTPASQDRLVQKVSVGYKFYRASASEADALNYPLGFYDDASGDLAALSGWDWIAEVTFARKSQSEDSILGDADVTSNIVFIGGGLKREFTNPTVVPHCQGLVGFTRFGFSASGDFLGEEFDDSDSESAFAIKVSCGVDYPLNDRWDVRGGAGYIRAFTESSGTNIIRLFVGVVRRLS